MGKRIRRAAALILIAVMLSLPTVGCSDGYTSDEASISQATEAVASAKGKTFGCTDISYSYAYFVDSTINKMEYRLGYKNVFNISGSSTDSFKANRYNYYYGMDVSDADTFCYSDGKLYTELYNTEYCVTMTEAEFMEYTDSTRYASDRGIFDCAGFDEVLVKGEGGGKVITFRGDDGTMSKKILTFLGLYNTDYVCMTKDIVYSITVSESGLLMREEISFIASYSTVDSPNDKVTYNGSFVFSVDKLENVTVNDPYIPEDIKEVSSIDLLDGFMEKAFGVLSTFTTLDASYDRYVYASDSSSEYVLENYVHFTEAYLEGAYVYGSIDTQHLKTPNTDETVKNGIFIDAMGFHTRSSTADASDSKDAPYSELEMIMMVFETLSGERPPDSDICELSIAETEETVIYTFSLTEDAVVAYGEYLLRAFAESESEVSLGNLSCLVKENQSVVTVRKSDGCVISHTLNYNAVFAGAINLESKFEMMVNLTGEDVVVLTLDSWES